mmetsp:Transcript_712/g.1063  ORF Transcript_712/g.1063 Transcript_712/m.1063 type:complete len:515 (-) Transcript_712:210-1754(-)
MSLHRGLALSAMIASMLSDVNAQGPVGGKDSSKLQIHIPQALFQEGGYEHREALFGVPPYGGSISQMVYYADSDLCDSNVDTRKGFPIRGVDDAGVMLPWPSPYILMVDRGSCTFVQKVRNAQRSGAAAVVIADTTCLCSMGDLCQDSNAECEPREPLMADDGSGADITIPSFLMFKQDADKVKAQLRSNSMVQMEMGWSLPSPDNRVEYDLWTTPTDLVVRDFMQTYKEAAVALGNRAYFTPHMYIYDGMLSNCQGDDGENQCYNLCTNNGRYCATDPDNNLDKGISGADVVVESLRRLCIWKVYGKDDGVGEKWWNYVNEFMVRCDNPDFFMSGECVDDVYKRVGINGGKVNKCMDDSGGVEDDIENELLSNELSYKEQAGVVIIPALFVNKVVIRGTLNFKTIFQAVCAGYLTGTEPDICSMCSSCPDEYKCTVNGYCEGNNTAHGIKGNVSGGVFISTLIGMTCLFFIAGACQYRRQQSQMRDAVKGVVAEYMPVGQDGKGMVGDDTQIT